MRLERFGGANGELAAAIATITWQNLADREAGRGCPIAL